MAGPLPNVDYMLTLGPSIAPEPGDAPVETVFAGLRYDFRPASADTEQPGVLLLGKDNRVSLYLANSATCEWDVLLSGKYEAYAGSGGAHGSASAARDSLDCVALFDPTTGTFRLETLLGQYNTKHARDAAPYRAPAEDNLDNSPPGTTSGSGGGGGPSTSPTSGHLYHAYQQGQPPLRRSDSPKAASPIGSGAGGSPEDAGAGNVHVAGGAGSGRHDRYGSSGSAGAGGSGASRPPRPPASGSGASREGSAGGKKRQREAGGGAGPGPGSGGGGSGHSPTGGPARKASRLSKSSGPEAGKGAGKAGRQAAGATPKGTPPPAAAKAAHAAGGAQGSGSGHARGAAKAASAKQAEPPAPAPAAPPPAATPAEEDVDAELLDAFDMFDEDLGGAGGDPGDEAEANGGEPAAAVHVPAAVELAATAPPAEMAVTPTLEEEMDEEPAPASPPRARLVVEAMDDDDGYGYGAEEEDGLGIEYF